MADDTNAATLEIRGLHAEVEGKEILKGIDLVVRQDETHALMGPNGSGKSTLSNVIMGRPGYSATAGEVLFRGENILKLTADQRAQRGLFLAMQYPVEVPGVSVVNFLRTAYQAMKGEQVSALAFRKHMKEKMVAARHRGRDGESLRQSGILRRGEEAKRDPPARRARAGDRHPRRDGLWARHRFAEAGGRRAWPSSSGRISASC